MNAPEPAAETGLGSHFGSTFASAPQSNSTASPSTSNNPFRQESVKHSPPTKTGPSVSERPLGHDGSPREGFPNYREDAFGGHEPRAARSGSHPRPPPSYREANIPVASGSGRRRTSSLKERFPGDDSNKPLDLIRKGSKRADRSPHLNKRHIPGADMIDRLDPALGGRAYHHEGPYDAALLSRNNFENSPIAALEESNAEAIKATPAENIKDAVERHKPLDGVAAVPPGETDRFGRTYNYHEGADLMHEASEDDPGYKRWDGQVCVLPKGYFFL